MGGALNSVHPSEILPGTPAATATTSTTTVSTAPPAVAVRLGDPRPGGPQPVARRARDGELRKGHDHGDGDREPEHLVALGAQVALSIPLRSSSLSSAVWIRIADPTPATAVVTSCGTRSVVSTR
jgi:hypothetical protein